MNVIHNSGCRKVPRVKDSYPTQVEDVTQEVQIKRIEANPNIQPRTEEERKRTFRTIFSAQQEETSISLSNTEKGESLTWFNFGDWTHPYYHKSHSQSALEEGVWSYIPSWEKQVDPPPTTYRLSRAISTPSRKYDPLGSAHANQALADLDRCQLRYRYSRYTMPDPWVTSMQSLQNPLKRHQPIPCLADQHKLSVDCKSFAHVSHSARAWTQEGQLTSLTASQAGGPTPDTQLLVPSNSTTETRLHGSAINKSAKKKVSWADQLETEDTFGNSSNNNNTLEDKSHQQRVELKSSELRETQSTNRLPVPDSDKYRVIKEGRYREYMNINSERCENDLPKDYKHQVDNISYRLVDEDNDMEKRHRVADEVLTANESGDQEKANKSYQQKAEYYRLCEPSLYTQKLIAIQNPCLVAAENREEGRIERMRSLLATDQLNYPYLKRGITGYAGHESRQVLELPLIKPAQEASMYGTFYSSNYCRNVPGHEYVNAKAAFGRRAPLSGQLTLSHPFNPFGTQRSRLTRHFNRTLKHRQFNNNTTPKSKRI